MQEKYVTEWTGEEIKPQDCYWYHDYNFLEGLDVVSPDYDLVPNLDSFLLPKDMTGKKFLDIGTGSGFFTFEMERRGAEVVSFDISLDEKPDFIPYSNRGDLYESNYEHRRQLHKSYWYAHRQFESNAKVVYGNVMKMPDWLGQFDVVLLSCILQHLRDPFYAIQQVDKHTKHTLIICEAYYKTEEPAMRFQADPDNNSSQYWTWWLMSPKYLETVMKVLGYKNIQISKPFDIFHKRLNYPVRLITIRGSK